MSYNLSNFDKICRPSVTQGLPIYSTLKNQVIHTGVGCVRTLVNICAKTRIGVVLDTGMHLVPVSDIWTT